MHTNHGKEYNSIIFKQFRANGARCALWSGHPRPTPAIHRRTKLRTAIHELAPPPRGRLKLAAVRLEEEEAGDCHQQGRRKKRGGSGKKVEEEEKRWRWVRGGGGLVGPARAQRGEEREMQGRRRRGERVGGEEEWRMSGRGREGIVGRRDGGEGEEMMGRKGRWGDERGRRL